ncbi:hypothetical protein DL98DRAFT_166312 [Cadophora sp. DSE1049]|nr:hypothetical protein DL98DRAFT_166312 [Cadophora sp. DSE1049]
MGSSIRMRHILYSLHNNHLNCRRGCFKSGGVCRTTKPHCDSSLLTPNSTPPMWSRCESLIPRIPNTSMAESLAKITGTKETNNWTISRCLAYLHKSIRKERKLLLHSIKTLHNYVRQHHVFPLESCSGSSYALAVKSCSTLLVAAPHPLFPSAVAPNFYRIDASSARTTIACPKGWFPLAYVVVRKSKDKIDDTSGDQPILYTPK